MRSSNFGGKQPIKSGIDPTPNKTDISNMKTSLN